MVTKTIQAIYLGNVNDKENLFDINFNRGSYQTNQPNDPDWQNTGPADTDDTTSEGAGLFIGQTYTEFSLREITLTSGDGNGSLNTYNPSGLDTVTYNGVTKTFEGATRLQSNLVFTNGTEGKVLFTAFQTVDGDVYLVDTHLTRPEEGKSGFSGEQDLGDVLAEHGGLQNLQSVQPTAVYEFGQNHRTNPNGGDYYDSRGGLAGIALVDGYNTSVESIPCYTAGTYITTDKGEKLVEFLETGDMVLTKDAGYQPILWVGFSITNATGANAAIQINPGTLPGLKCSMVVSRQHCFLFEYEGEERFVKANFFVKDDASYNGCVEREEGKVNFYHILLPEHAVIQANGIWSESFYPGPQILETAPALKAKLSKVIPGLESCVTKEDIEAAYGTRARTPLKYSEWKQFLKSQQKIAA